MILRDLVTADAEAVRRIYSGRSVLRLGREEMTDAEAAAYIGQCAAWRRQKPQVHYYLGIDVAGDLVGVVKMDNPASGRVLIKAGFTHTNDSGGYAHYVMTPEDKLS